MQWFEEQLRQREKSDDRMFADVFREIADSVSGTRRIHAEDSAAAANSAIDAVLSYFRVEFEPESEEKEDPLFAGLKAGQPRDAMQELEEKLRTRLEPHGIMTRRVKLEPGWEKCSVGPVLGLLDGSPAAFIPGRTGKYFVYDTSDGKKKKISGELCGHIAEQAFCFYEPLPERELTLSDLVRLSFHMLTAGDIVFAAVLVLAASGFSAVLPIASGYLFSDVANTGNLTALYAVGLALVCMVISSTLIGTVSSLLRSRIDLRQGTYVQSAVMMRVLSMPADFFRDFSSGELSQRMGYVCSLCTSFMSFGIDSLLGFAFSFVQVFVMANYAPSLIPVVFLILAVFTVLSLAFLPLQTSRNRKIMTRSAKEYGVGYVLISGVQKIKTAGAEKRAFAKWGKLYARKSEALYDPPLLLKISGIFGKVLGTVGTILIFAASVRAELSVGQFCAFNSSYGVFSSAFLAFVTAVMNLRSTVPPAMELIKPILSTVPEGGAKRGAVDSLRGRIELDHVSFSYGENMPQIINDLSLSIRPGEYVAIVGSTGCGKSTLIRLLLGFESPQEGSIYFDNYDLSGVDVRSLRRKIGVVTQNGRLFSGSIFSNIVISSPGADMDAAWRAAELADIADDIREMPMGMYTMVSEGSAGLSGGQRQRLMIARAVCSNPKVLIFDEATSALDNVSQKKVSDAVSSLNCTRIVVAHRLSTIRNCDRILVMDKGRIAEEGTYESLLEKNGIFAQLVARQRLD